MRLPPPLDLSTSALFLDLDGTLAPIEKRPDEVGPDPRRSGLLRRLGPSLGGRLAVVSGRTLETIDKILEGSVPSAAGVHGLERRRSDGMVIARTPADGLGLALKALSALALSRPGLLIEDKGLSVALHYRLAPEAEHEALVEAERLAAETGLYLLRGEKVVELRTPGADKGSAIRAFMKEAPFEGASAIFVGDDVTDEDGFKAAERLGGFGVLVGPPRRTAALFRLKDPAAVLAWLEAALG